MAISEDGWRGAKLGRAETELNGLTGEVGIIGDMMAGPLLGATRSDVVVLEQVLLVSSFRHLVTTEAVSLHTGKSPGLRLQLTLVAISEDYTNWRFALDLDLYNIFAPLRSN